MSYAVEVQADRSGTWTGNGCRYPSEEIATLAARDLAARWVLVTAWRVVPSEDPANYTIVDGRVVEYDHKVHAARVIAALTEDIARLGGRRRSRARKQADNARGLP